MIFKNYFKKRFETMVQKELGEALAKTKVGVVANDLKIKINFGDNMYLADVKIQNNTVEVGNFKKVK